ncbi:hypothetical protein HUS23_08515 [Ectothiorhodospiraceae bacterium 2226]|nr:hypothetical protein HUS23_08515 [Ectothiorhodospiraceae bacterium 2226]
MIRPLLLRSILWILAGLLFIWPLALMMAGGQTVAFVIASIGWGLFIPALDHVDMKPIRTPRQRYVISISLLMLSVLLVRPG